MRRIQPYGEKQNRRTIYQFADRAFRFWYRFVPKNVSLIELDEAEPILPKMRPALSHFLDPVFEDICREYLWDQMAQGTLPFAVRQLGKWWGTDPASRQQVEIDVAGGDGDTSILLGECKWCNEPVSTNLLQTLLEKRICSASRIACSLYSRNPASHADVSS